MTKLQRIKEITAAIIQLFLGIIVIAYPDEGYELVILLLSVWFLIIGFGTLIYYFQMACFMVGGRSILFYSIIMLDFGILTQSLTDVPHYYVLMYLILLHAFNGLTELLRVLEARRYGSKSWKLKFAHGMINILIAALCIIFIKRYQIAVIVYGLGLIYSAVMRTISACRRTTLIYIS